MADLPSFAFHIRPKQHVPAELQRLNNTPDAPDTPDLRVTSARALAGCISDPDGVMCVAARSLLTIDYRSHVKELPIIGG